VPFAHRRGDTFDVGPVGRVARLILSSDFVGDLGQTLRAASKQHKAPTALGKRAGDRGADPARAAGDDRDLLLS
jgi:hypothetical protein